METTPKLCRDCQKPLGLPPAPGLLAGSHWGNGNQSHPSCLQKKRAKEVAAKRRERRERGW